MDVPPSNNPAQVDGVIAFFDADNNPLSVTAVPAALQAEVDAYEAAHAASTSSGDGNGVGNGNAPCGCASDPDPGGRPDGGICFSPEALVRLSDGSSVRVGDIELGASLLSSGGRSVRVVALYRDSFAKSWIAFNGEPAFVTSGHPVSTARGFVPAGELVPGDTVHLESNRTMLLETVSASLESKANVNLETEDHRPYYVNGILFGSYPSYPDAVAERR